MSERTLTLAPGVDLVLRVPDDATFRNMLRLQLIVADDPSRAEELIDAMAATSVGPGGAPWAKTVMQRYGAPQVMGNMLRVFLDLPTKDYYKVGRGKLRR